METEPFESTEIVRADANLFEQHLEEILEIEKTLIENSSSAHLVDREDEINFMMDAFHHGGYAYLAMENGKVTGFIVVGPLDDGTILPLAVTQNYPVKNCLHIKVMYIKQTGKGIGMAMMQKLIDEIDKEQWEYLFVRTWVNPPNQGAIKFYTQKAGFQIIEDARVESTQTKKDGGGTFQIQKQYFQRKI